MRIPLFSLGLAAAVVNVVFAAQPQGFKIVVVQGEDAVNIIQQQTAVNPIVEVRDRNDDPPAAPAPPPCTYALDPSTQSASDTGGSFSAQLTTTCGWTVSADSSFLSITSATSGSGSATISYTVAANNLNRAPSRTGRLTVTGAGGTATLTVSQDAARVAVVTLTVTPNPVPQNGAPVTGIAVCAGVRNTWFYELRVIESGGVAITLNRIVDVYDGSVANDLPVTTRVNANSSVAFNYRWCHTAGDRAYRDDLDFGNRCERQQFSR